MTAVYKYIKCKLLFRFRLFTKLLCWLFRINGDCVHPRSGPAVSNGARG